MPTTILRVLVPRRAFLLSLAAASLRYSYLLNPSPGRTDFSVQIGDPVPIDESHGDTWSPTWASDGKMYSPSDDTYGFRNATDSNIAFNCISGSESSRIRGDTVNSMAEYGRSALEGADGCTWKSSGCAYIDSALYLVVARHKYGETSGDAKMRQTAANASIIRSADFAQTWHRSAKENLDSPMFPGHRFATPYFIQYGSSTNQTSNEKQHVYAISNNGFWDNGDKMIVGRVRRDRIARLLAADWEYFAGRNSFGREGWTKSVSDAKPVLESPGKLGMTGAVFVPAWRRYVMIGWYYPAGGGKLKGAASETVWEFYLAPEPWGPWTRIASQRSFPQGYYSPQVSPRFHSASRAYIWTAGNWNEPTYYKLTLLPLMLQSSQRG